MRTKEQLDDAIKQYKDVFKGLRNATKPDETQAKDKERPPRNES